MLRVNVLGTDQRHCAACAAQAHREHASSTGRLRPLYGVTEMRCTRRRRHGSGGVTEAIDSSSSARNRVCEWRAPWSHALVRDQAQEAGVYRTVRGRMTAETVAEAVWKAAHGRKLHWILAPGMGLIAAAVKLSPRLGRVLMKRLAIVP